MGLTRCSGPTDIESSQVKSMLSILTDSFLPAVNITKIFLLGKLSPQISNLFLKILQW